MLRGYAVRLLVFIGAAAAVSFFAAPAPASAAAGGHIESYDVDVTIRQDGTVHIKESIFYDFARGERHVISRAIPHRERLGRNRTRVYGIANIDVHAAQRRGSSPANPAADVTREGASVVVRITEPEATGGSGHYVISYDVRGAVTAGSPQRDRRGQPRGARFTWDIVGGWAVPIEQLRIDIAAPAAIANPACFAGTSGSRSSCLRMRWAGRTVRYWHRDLGAHQGITIAAGLPRGVAAMPPRVERPGTGSPPPPRRPVGVLEIMAAVLVLAVVPALVWLAGPRRPRGEQPTAVHITPPEDVPPGPGGVVLTGRAQAEHLTATLLDLATREFLRIEEVPGDAAVADWRLVRIGSLRPGLRRYEEMLLRALFAGRDEVRVSALGRQGVNFGDVRAELSRDATRRGWFRRPPHIQRRWLWGGAVPSGVTGVVLLGGAPAPGAAVLAVVGFVAVAGPWLVPRARGGAAVRRRLRALREAMTSPNAPLTPELQPAEAFDRLLPYAVVFDTVDSWIVRHADDVAVGRLGWYRCGTTGGPRHIADFTVMMRGVLATAPLSTGRITGRAGRKPVRQS